MPAPAIEIENVTKRFGPVVAVDRLHLRLETGTICGFLGQNGAGKTTTIRMIMSILYPDEGTVRVLGSPVPEAVKDRLGYLPEERGLYRKMKLAQMVAYFGRLKGLSASRARERSRELLTRYGLGEWLDHPCEALSKGMGQKAQILGTLLHDPELVILDEPFSGLDPVNVEVMRELILAMKREGRTVIFSTHMMGEAEKLCDQIVMIHKGKKRIDGPLAEVRKSAGHGVLLDYDGDGSFLPTLPGVERVNDSGKQAEIFLAPNADPQALLAGLIGRLSIRRFDLREPSLHEIFIRTVGEHHAA
jgi:ABC-2 type transport system ATP-binding protein